MPSRFCGVLYAGLVSDDIPPTRIGGPLAVAVAEPDPPPAAADVAVVFPELLHAANTVSARTAVVNPAALCNEYWRLTGVTFHEAEADPELLSARLDRTNLARRSALLQYQIMFDLTERAMDFRFILRIKQPASRNEWRTHF
jgi:hypothetical protein